MNAVTAEALASWLPAPGSDLYYAHLYAPAAERETLAALAALRAVIAEIPATCSAPTIALPKLSWWRDEMGQLARGTPRHVLTRALQGCDPDVPAAGLALISGVEALLGAPPFASRAARHAALLASHGPLWACALRRCAPATASVPAAALALAARVEEAYVLRDARPLRDGGLQLLSSDSEAAAAQRLGSLPGAAGDWHAAVLREDISDLRHALAMALAALPERRVWRPLATLARLALATLDEIARSDYRVWESRIELTPLRKLWLALRERHGL